MSMGLADSGIERWSFYSTKMTIAYCDKEGRESWLKRSSDDMKFRVKEQSKNPLDT